MPAPVLLFDLIRVFGRIGVLSFGGPAAQIALMHRELVDRRGWLSEAQFLNALSFCMMLPGPEAMQLATYAGWRQRGVAGGLIAGGLFVLPGALVVLALSALYVRFGTLPAVSAAFLGVKAAVVVIVIDALIKIAGRALGRADRWGLAALAFIAIHAFAVPFPAILAIAALYGAVTAGGGPSVAPPPIGPTRTIPTVLVWGGLWAAPLVALWAAGSGRLLDIGLFFSKLAIVTFGGAYAVLAYMAQDVVERRGWLSAPEMVDGLGLAETTPGPLILVTEFVGFVAGYGAGGWMMALAAAALTLWVTFLPCFLWIFAGAPFIEWIASRPRLSGALSAVTAAVVGVILNLSVWFAIHVFFGQTSVVTAGPFRLTLPIPETLDPTALAIGAMAAVLLLVMRWPLAAVLALAALSGLGAGLL